MASSLLPNPTTFLKPARFLHSPPASTAARVSIRCGPRDKRGPLVKGRVLSIEAIQAVQALKRAQRSDPNDPSLVSKTLSRLIKSDLVAALKELLRQDQCHLALQAFSALRSEYQPDVAVYAEVALALARNELGEEIDALVCELEKESGGLQWGSDKGLIRLIKAVVGADRRESTVRIYEMLKRNGWGSSGFEADEYMVRVLSKGLRKLGEAELADEVDLKFGPQLLVQS
ncbi:protein THYLAKOID ASSEMBLY 8, chloroplastic [Argentina anserina]|uniref:protein THYLAKOID ASSEMBLY 8, chloroplastic n=1 Tax=Argentina anserina TaxID=57926 RepID=UPI0021761E4A|nr:protein THYLAKOID ASSEMBLY 8, chloroplastic [Potentilla anserina]